MLDQNLNRNDVLYIGYFADGPWGQNTLRKLIADETIQVSFVCLRFDTQDTVIRDIAEENGIPVLVHQNINSDDFLELIALYHADLFISMSFNQIFRERIINTPKLKTINCHAGKLPYYRGRNILNWALINDEKEYGITVHYVDTGIDTGDIILQRTYPITDDDNYATLLARAYVDCADILYEAVKMIQNGDIVTIRQNEIHTVGFYCGIRGIGDEIINWNQTSREIFNFVRAICNPGPMARTYIGDKELKINRVKMISDAPVYKHTVGMIVGKTPTSFIVKTSDTTIEVVEYEYDGAIKIGARLKSTRNV